MDSSQFGKLTGAAALTLNHYFNGPAPQMVVRETLRFIDDNFRLQGWQGASFQPWAATLRSGLNGKGGLILVKKGDLRRGFNYQVSSGGDVLFYNNIPYAKVHNEGFYGMITVPAHTRTKHLKTKSSNVQTRKIKTTYTKLGEKRIEEYTRHQNIVQRQFAPTDSSPSPVLETAIRNNLEKDIKAILTF